MFILRDLLSSLQQQFSETKQGRRRAIWFSYTLLAVIVPFTSSITEPKVSGAGAIRFCLLRCAKADCRGGSESGILGAFAKSRATAAKFFHPHAVTHGGLRMESLGLQNS
jgi:hypothetical protein